MRNGYAAAVVVAGWMLHTYWKQSYSLMRDEELVSQGRRGGRKEVLGMESCRDMDVKDVRRLGYETANIQRCRGIEVFMIHERNLTLGSDERCPWAGRECNAGKGCRYLGREQEKAEGTVNKVRRWAGPLWCQRRWVWDRMGSVSDECKVSTPGQTPCLDRWGMAATWI